MEKNKTRSYIYIGLGMVCLILLTTFIIWANQTVTSTPAVTDVEGVSTDKSFKSLSTDLFSTKVSSTLTLKDQENEEHGTTLNQLFLTSNQGTPGNPITDQLGITVGYLPSDGLSGLSNVQFRLQREQLYASQQNPLPGKDAISFIKIDGGYEKSVFWAENGYYAAVVVSGTVDRATALNEELDVAISSWEWLAE